jgi:hypothetical protein
MNAFSLHKAFEASKEISIAPGQSSERERSVNNLYDPPGHRSFSSQLGRQPHGAIKSKPLYH